MIFLENVNKQFGPKILFRALNFRLRPGEKLGLVGENGMGKTTLLKVITEQESVDSGKVVMRKGIRCALLTQELDGGTESILDRVVLGDPDFRHVKAQMKSLEADEDYHSRAPEEWSKKYGELQHRFEDLRGYDREARAKIIMQGLGFLPAQLHRSLSEFSGGWRMRVELARLLLLEPDILLLDEPTNHLDLRSVVWLESFLKSYSGSILFISHDRRFINGLANRIIELDRGTLTAYTGNYDDYERQKAEREAQLVAQAANQGRRVAEVERFIERFRAKSSKATQVQSRVKMLAKMERVETADQSRSVHFRFPQPARMGRIVLELKDIDKSYGALKVYQNFSMQLERGWKAALVGENGAGKSTLLKIMAGVIAPDRGEVKPGANVIRAYYAQHCSEVLNAEHTALESLEEVAYQLPRTQKHSILGAFMFSGDDVNKKVGVLSGGEKARLAIARLLCSGSEMPSASDSGKPTAPSFLLLDEPTNHLDMRSREHLAAVLEDFEGSVLTISHDRFFLDCFINRVLEVQDGKVREYPGNYSDYEWAKSREAEAGRERLSQKEDSENSLRGDKEKRRQEAEERNQKYAKLKPLKSQLSKVEEKLETLMDELAQINLDLADVQIYEAKNKERLLKTLDRQKTLAQLEKTLMQEWDTLTTSIEKESL